MKKVLLGLLLVGSLTMGGCTTWESTVKNFKSDTSGIDRKVTVYSLDGKVLAEYEGKIMVTQSETSMRIDTANGKRVIFYNVSVVVEEK